MRTAKCFASLLSLLRLAYMARKLHIDVRVAPSAVQFLPPLAALGLISCFKLLPGPHSRQPQVRVWLRYRRLSPCFLAATYYSLTHTHLTLTAAELRVWLSSPRGSLLL
jgi:hypothetical protein